MSEIKVGDTVEVISDTFLFNSGDTFKVHKIDCAGGVWADNRNWTTRQNLKIVEPAQDIEALKDAVIKAAVNFRHRRFISPSWEDLMQAVDELEAATKPEPKHIPVMWAGKDHPEFAGDA